MKLGSFLPHETLLSKGLLQEWQPSMKGKVIFVSHQWLSYAEPDPEEEHFKTLQRVLARLLAGEVPRVEENWSQWMVFGNRIVWAKEWTSSLKDMYIWMDYISMPQLLAASHSPQHIERASKAVRSIPAYVELCSLMLVLTPVCSHKSTGAVCNLASWLQRGWCRLELFLAHVAPRDISVMVCTGAEAIPFFLQRWAFFGPVGEGCFSCCELGHRFQGMSIPCDKERLAPVLAKMVDAKVQSLRDAGLWFDKAYYAARKSSILLGLGTQPEESQDLCSFRKELHWEDDEKARGAGCSLLFFAALAGKTEVVRELLSQGGVAKDINQGISKPRKHLPGCIDGAAPLTAALAFGNFDCRFASGCPR